MPKFFVQAEIVGVMGLAIEADTLEESLAICQAEGFDPDESPYVVGSFKMSGEKLSETKPAEEHVAGLLAAHFGGTDEENQAALKRMAVSAHKAGVLTGIEAEYDGDDYEEE